MRMKIFLFLIFSFFFLSSPLKISGSSLAHGHLNTSADSEMIQEYFNEEKIDYNEFFLYLADNNTTIELSIKVSKWGERRVNNGYEGLGIELTSENEAIEPDSWLISYNDIEQHYLLTPKKYSGVYKLSFKLFYVNSANFFWKTNLTNPILWSYNPKVNLSQTSTFYFGIEREPEKFKQLKKLCFQIDFFENITNLEITIRDSAQNIIYYENFTGNVLYIDKILTLEHEISGHEWFSLSFNESNSLNSTNFASIHLNYDSWSIYNIVRLFFALPSVDISSIPIDQENNYIWRITKWYNSEPFLRSLEIVLKIFLYGSYVGLIALLVVTLYVTFRRKKRMNQTRQRLEQEEGSPSMKYKQTKYAPKNSLKIDFSIVPANFTVVSSGDNKIKCNICLNEIEKAESAIRCPSCDNIFHKNHLYHWIIQNGECPICKAKLRIIS